MVEITIKEEKEIEKIKGIKVPIFGAIKDSLLTHHRYQDFEDQPRFQGSRNPFLTRIYDLQIIIEKKCYR